MSRSRLFMLLGIITIVAPALIATALLLPDRAAADESEKSDLNQPPDGFRALFNGQDLTNWVHDEEKAKHWTAQNGILHNDGKDGHLRTEEDFGDFILHVDWKMVEKSDSGVFLRGAKQVQIWAPNKGGSGGLWNNDEHRSEPLVNADKPVGQWNSFRIKLVDQKATVYLNGKLVVDNIIMDDLDGRQRGPIVLQNHGPGMRFRNIFIKEIDDNRDDM